MHEFLEAMGILFVIVGFPYIFAKIAGAVCDFFNRIERLENKVTALKDDVDIHISNHNHISSNYK